MAVNTAVEQGLCGVLHVRTVLFPQGELRDTAHVDAKWKVKVEISGTTLYF